MTPFARQVRALIYEQLRGTGTAPTPDDCALLLGAAPAAVGEAFDELAAARAIVLQPGHRRVWMAHPFSAVPTPYRVLADGLFYWANCGWDAFAILALIGDGEGHVRGPVGDGRTRYPVSDGMVTRKGFVHFVTPLRHFWDDIGFT